MPFSQALLHAYVNGAIGMTIYEDDPREATIAFNEILTAYYAGEADRCNTAVADYQAQIAPTITPQVDLPKVSFESFFNNFAPFYYSAVLYLAVHADVSELAGLDASASRSAFWLICLR
jgi:hypothetical protein